MNLNNPNLSEKKNLTETSNQSSEISESQTSPTSATTKDEPSFGWSGYAERVNGRFAMIGFIAILLIEALSQQSFLHWAGLLS